MKIAYVILAHVDPNHIARLAKKVVAGTQHEVFIHVDLKSDIEQYERLLEGVPSVHFVRNRVKVYWAGYSSVEAIINAFREAVQRARFDRFYILQGLDYPIRTNACIENYFKRYGDTEFIRAKNESISKDLKDLRKYCYYWFMDNPPMTRRWLNAFSNVLYRLGVLVKIRDPYVIVYGRRFDIYRGWAHFAITRSAVDYILDFHDANPEFRRYFQRVFAADESYFHTILYNSHFVEKTVDKGAVIDSSLERLINLTYFEYPTTVTLFKDVEDYSVLERSGCLFFRKASSESKALLDHIDALHA